MIIGKDKERVRKLEAKLDQAKHLFDQMADDMRIILEQENYPIDKDWWRLSNDIGRCNAMAKICKED